MKQVPLADAQRRLRELVAQLKPNEALELVEGGKVVAKLTAPTTDAAQGAERAGFRSYGFRSRGGHIPPTNTPNED